MNDVRKDELIRLSLQRDLTPEEESRLEALLASTPDTRTQWEEERALSRALQSLPDVPVSSNFTSRVLQAVDAEEARDNRRSIIRPWFRSFLPRLSWAAVVVLLAFFGLQGFRGAKRAQAGKDISFVSADLAKLPPEVLQDFDAIDQLRQASTGHDDELLIALQ